MATTKGWLMHREVLQLTLPAHWPWIPEYKVTEAQGIDPRQILALVEPLSTFFGFYVLKVTLDSDLWRMFSGRFCNSLVCTEWWGLGYHIDYSEPPTQIPCFEGSKEFLDAETGTNVIQGNFMHPGISGIKTFDRMSLSCTSETIADFPIEIDHVGNWKYEGWVYLNSLEG